MICIQSYKNKITLLCLAQTAVQNRINTVMQSQLSHTFSKFLQITHDAPYCSPSHPSCLAQIAAFIIKVPE